MPGTNRLFKICIFSLTLIVVFFFAYYVLFYDTGSKRPLVVTEEKDLLKFVSKDMEAKLIRQESTKKNFMLITGKTDEWNIVREGQVLGTLILDLYTLQSNGDCYYFIRYAPVEDHKEDLVLSLNIKLKKFRYRNINYPNGLNYERSVWSDETVGKINQPLPKSSLYIDDAFGSYFFSYINVFEKQENEVKKERYDLSKEVQAAKDGITLRFPHIKDSIVEQWGIISNDTLVDWKNKADISLLKRMDLNRARKWGADGVYEVTPDTYYPSSPSSFWRNPGQNVGKALLKTPNERFFNDFIIVSLYTAVNTQNNKGYWWSMPRSNWLYSDYGIGSKFFDTRFNTDAALFLLRGYKRYGDFVFLDAAGKYGDFYVRYANSHHFTTKNDGILVWDYGDETKPNAPTHVSLNHLVTGMNYLYELYKVTKDQRYFDTAQKIRTAVKDTREGWKMHPEGDLWYSYKPGGTYGGNDYPLITLNDLRYAQGLFKELEGANDADFDYLIKVKEAYLTKKGMPLH